MTDIALCLRAKSNLDAFRQSETRIATVRNGCPYNLTQVRSIMHTPCHVVLDLLHAGLSSSVTPTGWMARVVTVVNTANLNDGVYDGLVKLTWIRPQVLQMLTEAGTFLIESSLVGLHVLFSLRCNVSLPADLSSASAIACFLKICFIKT